MGLRGGRLARPRLEGREVQVSFASLNRADVGPMKIAPVRELLLRLSRLVPQSAEICCEDSAQLGFSGHAAMLCPPGLVSTD